MLEAFIHEVRAFKNAGILEPGQADEMIRVAEAADRVSRGLSDRQRPGDVGPGITNQGNSRIPVPPARE